MKVLEKLQIKENILQKATFKILILKLKDNKNSFQGKILGRTLCDWVSASCVGHDICVYDYDEKTSILDFVKNKLDRKYHYTIVLTSRIPLFTIETLNRIKEYTMYKNIKLCKLPVGYVISNELLEKDYSIDSIYSQDIEDFYIVENKKQFTYALGVLQDRINTFHIDNGVEIVDPQKVYIEPEVDIYEGVIIYPMNTIKGKSILGEKCILKENNVIDNSRLGKECCVSSSIITDSVMGKYVFVSPFCEINNSILGDDVIVSRGAKIEKDMIGNGEKI